MGKVHVEKEWFHFVKMHSCRRRVTFFIEVER